MRRLSLAFVLLLISFSADESVAASRGTGPAIAAQPVARVPIAVEQNHIFLLGQIGDSTLWLTVDTGASTSLLEPRQAEHLGIAMHGSHRIYGAAGSAEGAYARQVRIRLSGAELRIREMRTLSLEALSTATGHPLAAILGSELFKRYVVALDYPKGEIRLYDPARFVYRGNGAVLPLTFDENQPYVRARLELPQGKITEGEFVLDAGSGSTLMLAPEFAAAHGLPASLERKLEGRGGAVGGEMSIFVGRIPALHLGPYEFPEPVVMFPGGEITRPGSPGNIGGGLLRRFNVIFDYSRRRMILEPSGRLGDPDEYDMSGVSVMATGPKFDGIQVIRVREQSPGDEAGVKANDRIQSVDG